MKVIYFVNDRISHSCKKKQHTACVFEAYYIYLMYRIKLKPINK